MRELTSHLDLPSGLHAPATARRALDAILRSWGLRDEHWLGVAAIVANELVTNAVLYGGGCIVLTVDFRGERVVVSVTDGSPVAPHRRDPDRSGGRGIMLIEALSTRWGSHALQIGKRVWVELRPYPSSSPGSADQDEPAVSCRVVVRRRGGWS